MLASAPHRAAAAPLGCRTRGCKRLPAGGRPGGTRCQAGAGGGPPPQPSGVGQRRQASRSALDHELELLSLRQRLQAHQGLLEAHVQRQDYAAAAAERDACLPLQLRLRQLALGAAAEAKSEVLHALGQVVQHRRYGYLGVIFGYDPRCMAPEEWCEVRRAAAVGGGRLLLCCMSVLRGQAWL